MNTSIFSMSKYEGSTDPCGGGGRGGWPRVCDSCRSAPSAVYYLADAAYVCAGCDSQVHRANRVASRHERVWVCERAPAAVTCRADAGALCAACDAEVHSANPLAGRHHRVPILPLPSASAGVLPGRGLPGPFLGAGPAAEERVEEEEEDEETASGLLMSKNCNRRNNGALFGRDQVDEYLDLVGYNACSEIQTQEQRNYGKNEVSECVVPSHGVSQQQQSYGVDTEYEVSNAGLSYTASLSHSVSFASMDASIVEDTAMTADVSNSHFPPPLQMASQFPLDREAKVLGYREKRKTRKFEKTIRYASRKAYAETRPRIKGRFAKPSK